MRNIYRVFLDLLPARPLQVGTITSVEGEVATVQLPGGGLLIARGVGAAGAVGATVFVRDGLIEGEAPSLPVEVIEI
ncbi:hypothetical protein [Variovorax paradoxus]|uniref:Uncharacterized protein n=1 Tax=Variovorax paradoxus TaxID=34073 RepID=A0A6I6HJ88_VARPD|nr:hypothetical protein [Variovorax paradoxus]QGW82924.1 hypothetical protein GOQ09_15670 [Variovorax paradoxus]